MIVGWVVAAWRFMIRWFYGRWLPSPAEIEAMRPTARPPEPPPLALNVGLTRPAIGTRSVRPLTQIEQIIDDNGPAMRPYDYWREIWLRSGDLEALRQMERFVEWWPS